MTNREYLTTLSDEEFAHTLHFGFLCHRCSYGNKNGSRCKVQATELKLCDEGIAEWLKREYDGSADLR